MSIKGFLEVQEMQEGGPAMFTPFAVDPEGSPRRRIAPTYQPNPPPTIALPPIAPITPTPTPEQLNISPDPNYMGSIDMTLAQAGATKHGLGTLNPHWNQEFLSTLESEGRPETDLSRALDRGFKALATPALAVATLAVPAIAPMTGLFSAVTGRGGGGILSSALSSAMGGKQTPTNLGTSQFQTQTAPQATTSAIPQTPTQQFAAATGNSYALGDGRSTGAPAPVGYTLPGGGFGSTVTPAAGVNVAPNFTTAAQAGSDKSLFGAAYGQGRGGKGMFSSFAHYAAGINEGEEAAAVAAGVTSGAFASIAEGAETVDGLVSRGYDQAEVDAIAGGNVVAGNTSLAALTAGEALEDAYGGGDGGGDGGSPVICTQLFSMGIMSANLYQGEGEHAKNIPNIIRRGYHFWAVPFVRGMRKNQLLFKLGKTLGLSWAQYAAHKANPDKFAPNYLGTVINAIGTPICATLGLFVGETDWETLWIDYEKGNGLCLDQQN
jgi:hypothetical protein